MHLPEINRFIAEDLSLKPAEKDVPKFPLKLVEENEGELFYRRDDAFLKPLAYINFFICSPLPLASLKDAVCLDLMVSWLSTRSVIAYCIEVHVFSGVLYQSGNC